MTSIRVRKDNRVIGVRGGVFVGNVGALTSFGCSHTKAKFA